MIEDLESNGHSFAAKRIFAEWPCASRAALLEYHFFNELDNIAKFEKPGDYPEAEGWIRQYSTQVVSKKIESCPDPNGYFEAEAMLRMFLCVYAESDMRLIRGYVLRETHSMLPSLQSSREKGPLTLNLRKSDEELFNQLSQAMHARLDAIGWKPGGASKDDEPEPDTEEE